MRRTIDARLAALEARLLAEEPVDDVIWFDVADDQVKGLQRLASERGHTLTVTDPIGDWGRVAMILGADVDEKMGIIYGE